MFDQIRETWFINNRANILLLEAISPEGLCSTLSKRGGRSVALQFAHLHNVRLWRLEKFAKDLYAGQEKIPTDREPERVILIERMNASAGAMADFLQQGIDNGGIIKGFKRGVIPLLGYMISHEAHHRGNVLLTLKQCGCPVPREVRDRLCAWNQI